MIKYFLGIDPGSSGAITILSDEGKIVESFKLLPTILENWRSLEKYKENIEKGELMGLLEQNHPYGVEGVSSAFTFGFNSCLAETIYLHNKIPFERISPQGWMKGFCMVRIKNESQTLWKGRLYKKACELYPLEKFYIYQSDSILIATYLRNKIMKLSFR